MQKKVDSEGLKMTQLLDQLVPAVKLLAHFHNRPNSPLCFLNIGFKILKLHLLSPLLFAPPPFFGVNRER